MIKKLATLIVEDSEADTELIVQELRDGGFDPVYERVDTKPAMIAALEKRDWDIIISDYSMPQFGGDAALALLQDRGLDVPFISVSGTMGEDVAVAMMKAGAHDYVMKDDLKRLVPAVERELEAASVRRERRRAEESRSLLAAIVASSDDAIISTTLDGMVLSWNRGAEQMYGYTAQEMISQPVSILIPRDRPNEMVGVLETFKQGEHAQRYETVRVRKDGTHVTVSLTISPVMDASNQIIGASSIARDISEHKKAEAHIAASLREKEVLLREIHHRVKNNLQVVCSLLHLQSKLIRDKKALEVFRESEARIRSMALIHEKLYQSENLAHVQFDDYVRSLLGMALPSYNFNANAVRLEASLQPTSLGMELAVPLGLILNELVSNGVRHGFPEGRSGVIAVDLHRRGDHRLALAVRDNGVGLPGNFTLETTASLGLRLVKLLTDQIGGELTYRNNGGAEFTLTCPEPQHA